MNNQELLQLITTARAFLRPHLERSGELRELLGGIGRLLIDEVESVDSTQSIAPAATFVEKQGSSASVVDDPGDAQCRSDVIVQTPPPQPLSSGYVPLKLGDGAVIQVPVVGTTADIGRARSSVIHNVDADAHQGEPINHDIDPSVIERRSRVKADSCRLFIERRKAPAASAAEQSCLARMNDMIIKGKSIPNCFLWVFRRMETQPSDSILEQISACYEAQIDGLGLYRKLALHDQLMSKETLQDLFQLIAEANSALRASLQLTWLTDDDKDQTELHLWLRHQTHSRRIFVQRYMSVNDPADPTKINELRARMRTFNESIDKSIKKLRDIKNALDLIKHHSKQIVAKQGIDCPRDWRKIRDAVERLQGFGIASSDRRIAEVIGESALQFVESAEEQDRPSMRALMESIDVDSDDESSESIEREAGPEILRARDLLKGKHVVLLGGLPNETARSNLAQSLELGELEWVHLEEHASSQPLQAPIARPETALVIILIKFIGHGHAEEAKIAAERAGKPLVRLTGGYNPTRVAVDILEQASERLSARSE